MMTPAIYWFSNPRREDVAEKQPPKKCHAEWFDKPVHEYRYSKSARLTLDVKDRTEIHFQHHGVDHEPEEDGDDDIDVRCRSELETTEQIGALRKPVADADTNQHTNRNPQREIALKDIQSFCLAFTLHETPLFKWRRFIF